MGQREQHGGLGPSGELAPAGARRHRRPRRGQVQRTCQRREGRDVDRGGLFQHAAIPPHRAGMPRTRSPRAARGGGGPIRRGLVRGDPAQRATRQPRRSQRRGLGPTGRHHALLRARGSAGWAMAQNQQDVGEDFRPPAAGLLRNAGGGRAPPRGGRDGGLRDPARGLLLRLLRPEPALRGGLPPGAGPRRAQAGARVLGAAGRDAPEAGRVYPGANDDLGPPRGGREVWRLHKTRVRHAGTKVRLAPRLAGCDDGGVP
mmetsp:Transcript_37007/g.104398  ORF Transcript_37007/g.104398 Transcript_37007/m.104398 type:complete len:259 (+) Transcript_37007:1667-2443(+)